ncbi:MAG TPA: hypothetical protein VKU77_37660 [Streptosporangiaceae bacterium]|nr:hypothetical protein [Streptosporangiaceae bacterium]
MPEAPLRQRLQLALRSALRARDTIAVSALRTALSAIDNASAIPAGPAPAAGTGGPHFAGAVPGLGAAEATRRALTEREAEQIVRAEVAERQAAAHDYDQAGRPGQAKRLRREAQVLTEALDPR